MATPTIRLSGATSGAGTPGAPNSNLIIGEVVTADDPANPSGSSFLWSLFSKPVGSSATLSGGNTATATFTPDVAGTYLVRLLVDGAESGVLNAVGEFITDQGGGAVLHPNGLRVPSELETEQFGGWHTPIATALARGAYDNLTFTANDATPSVSQVVSVYTTANTVNTTITNFDDGYDGQRMLVVINDTKTTVDFTSSGLLGNNGVDWNPTTGDFMYCSFNGVKWDCLVSSFTFPRTATEISAAVTPANYRYEPGNVLRYGTNTVPATTDMTAAIQAAVDSCPTYGTVFLPKGEYSVTDTINFTRPLTFKGEGFLSAISVYPTVDASTDIFSVVPASDGHYFNFSDFAIYPKDGVFGPGRHALALDATTTFFMDSLFHNVVVYPLNGNAINIVGDGAGEGSLGLSKISDCVLGGGIAIEECGDNVIVEHCHIVGSGKAVEVAFVPGAANFILQSCNITNDGGIYFGAWSTSVKILDNEIETFNTFTGSNGALVDIDGDVTVGGNDVTIANNSFQVVNSVVTNTIRVNYANRTNIYGNRMGRGDPGSNDVVITANAVDTIIGQNTWPSTEPEIVDSGTNTSFDGVVDGNWRTGQYIDSRSAASGVDGERIRLGRTEDGNRYSSIYSKSDDSGNATVSFRLHDGVTGTSQVTVLTLKGDGSITAAGAFVNSSTIYGSALGITSLFDITSDGTKTTLLPTTGDYLRVGDAGTTSHTLNTNDDLLVSGRLEVDGILYVDDTSTDGGIVWTNGASVASIYHNGGALIHSTNNTNIVFLPGSGNVQLQDDYRIIFGNTTANFGDASLSYNTDQTPDALVLGLSADSNNFIICENADAFAEFDFAHAASTDPTLFIHSGNQTTTEWIGFNHNGVDAQVRSGFGRVQLLPVVGSYTVVGDAGATSHALNTNDDLLVSGRLEVDGILYADSSILAASTIYGSALGITSLLDITSDGTRATILPASGDYLSVGDAFATSHTLNTNDDLLVTGRLEVDGIFYADSTSTFTDTITAANINGAAVYGTSIGITSLLDITSDGTRVSIVPATGDYTVFGAGATGHSLNANGDVLISGVLEVNGFSYLDGGLVIATDSQISIGTGFNARLYYSSTETPDSLVMGLPSSSNGLVICETGDISFDHAHALQTNPTLFIHSAAQNTSQWISFTHDGTDGLIDVGTGVIKLLDMLQLSNAAVNEALTVTHSLQVKDSTGTTYKFAVQAA